MGVVGGIIRLITDKLKRDEKEKKENYKHSSMTTEAIFTLVCNAFGLFRERPTETDATAAVAEEIG